MPHAIILINGQKTLIDEKDYEKLSGYRWGLSSTGYVARTTSKGGKYKTFLLHRVIMSAKKGEVIDHINNNPLDNRRENLRFCTQKQNVQNQRTQLRSKSGFKGVCWDNKYNKWRSYIVSSGKQKFLGYYEDKERAAEAYNKAASERFGQFANFNII